MMALQRHHATAQGWRLLDLKQKLPSSSLGELAATTDGCYEELP